MYSNARKSSSVNMEQNGLSASFATLSNGHIASRLNTSTFVRFTPGAPFSSRFVIGGAKCDIQMPISREPLFAFGQSLFSVLLYYSVCAVSTSSYMRNYERKLTSSEMIWLR